jgi:transposase
VPQEIDDDELARVVSEWREAADIEWATVAEAERVTGVSRSALRAWYRNGDVPSHLVDGPHGQQRLVDLEAVVARAAQAGNRVGRRRTQETIELLLDRIDELEARIETLERRSDPT